MTNQINEENIRVAAYYIWEQAGRPEGAEKECWIKACEQLFAAKPAAKKCSSSKPATKCATKSAAKPTVKAEKTSAKPAAKKPAAKKSATAKPAVKAEPFYGIRK